MCFGSQNRSPRRNSNNRSYQQPPQYYQQQPQPQYYQPQPQYYPQPQPQYYPQQPTSTHTERVIVMRDQDRGREKSGGGCMGFLGGLGLGAGACALCGLCGDNCDQEDDDE